MSTFGFAALTAVAVLAVLAVLAFVLIVLAATVFDAVVGRVASGSRSHPRTSTHFSSARLGDHHSWTRVRTLLNSHPSV